MAARLRRELGFDVDMIHGRYGEFKVLVDGAVVIDGGAKVVLGIMPPMDKVVKALRGRLSG